MAQMVKSLPTKWETRVWCLGREDPLEKEIATHFSILAWKIPWMEEPGRLQSMGSQRGRQDWATSLWLSNVENLDCNSLGKVNACLPICPDASLLRSFWLSLSLKPFKVILAITKDPYLFWGSSHYWSSIWRHAAHFQHCLSCLILPWAWASPAQPLGIYRLF